MGGYLNYYEHHIGDYAQATLHLSFIEDAAFVRMLRKYYADEKPLPADIAAVQRVLGARTQEEREAVETVLREFFVLEADGWHNKRCDEEIAKFRDKQEKAKRSANARWKPEVESSERNADAMPTQCEPDANAMRPQCERNALQTPDTRHHSSNAYALEKKTATTKRPDGVTEEVWLGFLTLRRAKKAPVTAIALRGIEAEAKKAGLTLQQVLELCCARGWTGFKAEWVREEGASPRVEAAQALMRGLTRGLVGGHANVKLIA